MRTCFRPFWATLIFWPKHTPNPTLTTENEKAPDLAWHKLKKISNFLFKVLFNFFCSIFFSSINECSSHQNKKSSRFKIIWTKMHCKRLLPYLWPLTNFKTLIRFQNFSHQNMFSYLATYLASYLAIHLVICLLSYNILTQVQCDTILLSILVCP